MKTKYKKLIIVGLTLVGFGVSIAYIPISPVLPFHGLGTVQVENQTVCVLTHEETTGVGWVVSDSNDHTLIGQPVILNTLFDPRLLHHSIQAKLDVTAQYVISVQNYFNVHYEDTQCLLIDTPQIAICNEQSDVMQHPSCYRLKDMSVGGILKMLLGFFSPQGHWSI